jgi:hypothetical protein
MVGKKDCMDKLWFYYLRDKIFCLMNPVLKRIGYRDQDPCLALNAPANFTKWIADTGAAVHNEAMQTYDFVICFAQTMEEGVKLADVAVKAVNHDKLLWFCYPKGTSRKFKSDIQREKAWSLFKPYAYRPVSQVAIDDDWSALRFRKASLVKSKS